MSIVHIVKDRNKNVVGVAANEEALAIVLKELDGVLGLTHEPWLVRDVDSEIVSIGTADGRKLSYTYNSTYPIGSEVVFKIFDFSDGNHAVGSGIVQEIVASGPDDDEPLYMVRLPDGDFRSIFNCEILGIKGCAIGQEIK